MGSTDTNTNSSGDKFQTAVFRIHQRVGRHNLLPVLECPHMRNVCPFEAGLKERILLIRDSYSRCMDKHV